MSQGSLEGWAGTRGGPGPREQLTRALCAQSEGGTYHRGQDKTSQKLVQGSGNGLYVDCRILRGGGGGDVEETG